MLYQLSYDRLVLLRPQPMSTSTSSMCPSYLLPDASPRHARLPDFRRPHPRVGWRQVWPMFLCKPWGMVDVFFGVCLCNRNAGASSCRTRTWCIGSFPSGQAASRRSLPGRRALPTLRLAASRSSQRGEGSIACMYAWQAHGPTDLQRVHFMQ